MRNCHWTCDAVIYEMNVRQMTAEGTFNAAAERLPFLKNMGIDIIWLMPIYPIGKINRKGSLGSYYSIRDYMSVNPEFGTMEDLDSFVEKAHRLGMKVILDWVANHTARDARWLSERPYSWYEREANGEAKIPWDWSDTAKLNYVEKGVWADQIEAMKFWLTQHSIDGFRCDMAMLVPIEFWQMVRIELERVKPDVFMLAEAEETNLFDNAFDASYAWEFHHIICDIAAGKRRVWDLRNYLNEETRRYPIEAQRLMFTSNHDENSWSGSEFARFGEALKCMTALTFVLPRTLPLIYTGQEFGYNHSFSFFDKDSMPAFEPNEFTEHYRKLCDIRHKYSALQSGIKGGSYIEINNNAPDCCLTFAREDSGATILGLFNLSPYSILRDFHIGIYGGYYTNLLTGESVSLPEHLWGEIAPWSYRILLRKKH